MRRREESLPSEEYILGEDIKDHLGCRSVAKRDREGNAVNKEGPCWHLHRYEATNNNTFTLPKQLPNSLVINSTNLLRVYSIDSAHLTNNNNYNEQFVLRHNIIKPPLNRTQAVTYRTASLSHILNYGRRRNSYLLSVVVIFNRHKISTHWSCSKKIVYLPSGPELHVKINNNWAKKLKACGTFWQFGLKFCMGKIND